MSWIDWGIIAAYLIYIIYAGVRQTQKHEGVEGYFLANRSIPWWAVGLSVMATQMSAITLVGTTGQAYEDGVRFIQFYFGLPLAMVILCVTVVPFFYRARVYTAYEYLERRFDARTRSLTSFSFLMSRGLSVGVIISAPSVILSIILGWNEVLTIMLIGLSTTIYTMFGGVRAVTWTDVRQMVVVLVGLAVVLGVIISQLPTDVSVGDALRVVGATGRMQTIDTSFDLSEKYTLWSGLIGGLFLMLSYFGCDQSQVQRYLTARSLADGRSSLILNAFVKIPMQFVILLIGVLVFAFYQFQKPPMIFHPVEAAAMQSTSYADRYSELEGRYDRIFESRREAALDLARTDGTEQGAVANYQKADASFRSLRTEATMLVDSANGTAPFTDINYVFPTFIMNNLPVGVVGLLIAAIFAAAMSSISSELNALSTATVIDFYRRHFRPEASDNHYLFVSRIATAFWGVFACVVAVYAQALGSLVEVVNKFGSYFYGSILGVFVLAIGTRRATGRGAFWGLIAGIATVGLLDLLEVADIAFLWYNLVGCAVVVGVGMLLSAGGTGPDRGDTTVESERGGG